MRKSTRRNWIVPSGVTPTELDKKVLHFQNSGWECPLRRLVLNQEQIEGVRRASIVNNGVLDEVAKNIHEGMSTDDIDAIVFDYTKAHGAIPADLGYEGFPKSVCTSVNNVVCHGVPSKEEILKDGDIVNVDVTTILDGFYSDASRMFLIGNVSPQWRRLVEVTKECLDLGAAAAKPFTTVGNIGYAIEQHALANGYSVVQEYVGHGVGLNFHDLPDVLHYGRKNTGMLLVPGMVFTIEPMINMGRRDIFIDKEDGWTTYTADGLPSAQWEHTYLMTDDGLEILSE